jgi:ribosomal protein S18 acetylase RimI-like enzyme
VEPVARLATADSVDPVELAAVAARTFPLACPPSVTLGDIASFIDAHLSDARFAEYLADPRRLIFTTSADGPITGYAMLIRDGDRTGAELSKMYVLPAHHGSGLASALMSAALTTAAEQWRPARVWLGVNQKNERAQRFYTKSGFSVTGTRTFQLGAHTEHDYVMTRPMP